jgi:hypothetical protein
MGDDFDCLYNGILGRDFWEGKKVTINYCDRTISMGEVVLNFDDITDKVASKPCRLTLKARTRTIVRLPTKPKGHGLLSKREIVSGIFLAESSTVERNGYCVMSIVNNLGEGVRIEPPN